MRTVCDYLKILTIFLFSILTTITVCYASEPKEIAITQITPTFDAGWLVTDVKIDNLFNRKITGIIQSGLPAAIEIEIRLLEEHKKKILSQSYSYSITYRIWDEEYLLSSVDTVETFKQFDDLKQRCSHFRKLPVIPQSKLGKKRVYILRIRASMIPLSTNQKLSNWLHTTNQTRDELTLQKHSSGFRFNLSGLISFFVNNDKSRKERSAWREKSFQP